MPDDILPATVQPLVIPEIVTLPAEIDINSAPGVAASIRAAFRPGVAAVIADMSGTRFCDSTGARELLVAADHAERCGAELRLVVGEGPVLRMLGMLGFDRLLRIYPTPAAALSGAGSPES